MTRCLDLARAGEGMTSPNPMVGSVIVHDNKIIGEGYHIKAGGAHAEVHAVNAVKDKSLLQESTLFVNLEPCCHQGRTPACTGVIMQNKIPNVVIGSLDSNPLVAGKGVEILRKAGVNVTKGVLENKCRFVNRRFYTYHQKKRPYIILKWAQTMDGYLDICRGKVTARPTWITSEPVRWLVHKWRAEEDAVLVGTDTALMDNPCLNVRDWHGKNPLRLVLDKSSRLPADLQLFDGNIPTIVYTGNKKTGKTNLQYREISFDNNILEQILEDLYQQQVLSVFIEGGAKLLNSFISSGSWDEARVFAGNIFFRDGIKAPALPGEIACRKELENCFLFITRNTRINEES